jgi:phosphatidylserine decarboxylase
MRAHSIRSSRLGGWLPPDPKHLAHFLRTARSAAKRHAAEWHPVIRDFLSMIETDPVLLMYFTRMFEEQPRRRMRPIWGEVRLKNYQEMLKVLNHVIQTAPEYNRTYMVGFPINAILDCPMITPAGLAAFADEKVNAMLRRVLRAWTEFLDSPRSRYVLNDSASGWLSASAHKVLRLQDFVTAPQAPYFGFKSWNDFFIRRFKPGLRPVAAADDPKVIVNACEAAPFAIARRARARDHFWLKEQPYSLQEMLAGHFVEQFVGGTVYQGFLSARNYHRWHSPIAGTVRRLQQIAGTYYAEAAAEHFDPVGPNNSQGYLSHVATRALLFIDADEAAIGLVCVVFIGMAEVSSCIFEDEHGQPLREKQHLRKGDQVGYFQFGGSTHCVLFGPQVRLRFVPDAHPKGPHGSKSKTLEVNSQLATIR